MHMISAVYGGHHDCMVVAFANIYAISACEYESHSWRVVLDTTLCDQVCQ